MLSRGGVPFLQYLSCLTCLDVRCGGGGEWNLEKMVPHPGCLMASLIDALAINGYLGAVASFLFGKVFFTQTCSVL